MNKQQRNYKFRKNRRLRRKERMRTRARLAEQAMQRPERSELPTACRECGLTNEHETMCSLALAIPGDRVEVPHGA